MTDKIPLRYGVDEYIDTASFTLSDDAHHVIYSVSQIREPVTMEEAIPSEYFVQRKQAADSEYKLLIANGTWELVELPAGCTPIGCKWIFKVKYDKDGRIEQFKGHLVAKGYAQKHSKGYKETFSPVVRFSSIRTLLAFTIQHNLLIY